MSTALTSITELTEGTVTGNGAFDKLMAAGRAHLDQEYKKGALRGPEYSQVYIGMIESCMQGGLNWIIQGAKINLERELLGVQVDLAKVQKQIADVQLLKTQAELEMLELQKPKIIAEVKLIEAQVIQMEAENALIPKKIALMTAEVELKEQQVSNMVSEQESIEARNLLTAQQTANAVVEGKVLEAQECKLRAEYNLIMNQIEKSSSEVALLVQKTVTEKAQTQALGVDDNSVIGRQKQLYVAQTDGFKRDAEQKAAKIIIDTWNARRVSDPDTVADGVNKLNDATVGAFVTVLKAGVGA